MPSAVFISALTEMDAVLDSRIIDDIVDAARKLTPAFVAIAGTPIPMMILASISRGSPASSKAAPAFRPSPSRPTPCAPTAWARQYLD